MRVPLHIVESRRETLARLLGEHRYLPVSELCSRLGVSEATVRRDLSALEQAEKITRTYGGALGQFNETFASAHERAQVAVAAKRRIAAVCRPLIKAGSTVFFDGGTTVLEIARALVENPVGPLTIVTNNLAAAELLGSADAIEVILLGGRLLSRQAILIDAKAGKTLSRWSPTIAFLSAEGMDAHGIYNSHEDIVALQRSVIECARNVYLCLDASKLGHVTAHRLAQWSEIAHLVTNAPRAKLAAARIRLEATSLIAA